MDERQRRLAEELLFTKQRSTSVAKTLFFGLLNPQALFPFPTGLEAEQEAFEGLFDQFAEFCRTTIDADAIDRSADIPHSVIKGLGSLGLLGMTIPQEYGGLGMSQFHYCKMMEHLGGRCAATAVFVNAHHSIGVRSLLLFGTEEQKKKWLRPLATGEKIAAFSLTEPNAGSDASAVETRAVYDPERNIYRLTGKKQWTSNGSIAQVLTVMARTQVETPQGVQDKITAFLVTPDMPGFKITAPALEKVGIRGTKTTNLEFCEMEVPADNILGQKGAGLRICLTALDYGRTTFGATCTGAAKFLLAKAVEHAQNRWQFHRPLASFALVKKKIATIASLTYAMEATTYVTAALIDAKAEDVMLESAILKVFNSEALWQIIYETMQIFGGRSLFTAEPLERMMRDARLNMIGEGANEVLRAFIGAVGMRDVGMQLKGGIDALKNPIHHASEIMSFFKEFSTHLRKPVVPVQSVHLAKERKQLSAAIQQFGVKVVEVLACYREDVVEKQLDLNRIANCAIALYTSLAVISRLDALLVQSQITPLYHREVMTAKYYLNQAQATFRRNIKMLFLKQDADTEDLSDMLTGWKSL